MNSSARIRSRIQPRLSNERGAGFVEFLVISPIFFMVIFAGVDVLLVSLRRSLMTEVLTETGTKAARQSCTTSSGTSIFRNEREKIEAVTAIFEDQKNNSQWLQSTSVSDFEVLVTRESAPISSSAGLVSLNGFRISFTAEIPCSLLCVIAPEAGHLHYEYFFPFEDQVGCEYIE